MITKNQTVPQAKRYDYFLECSRASHEHVMYHISQRSSLIKLQLYTQAGLLALALGFTIKGISAAPDSLSYLLALAFPISAILAALYAVEDRLVVHYCEYYGSLSEKEMKLSDAESIKIENKEVSTQMGYFAKTTLQLRYFAQIVAFVILPTGLCLFREIDAESNLFISAMNALLLIVIFLILTYTYLHHRDTSERLKSSDGSNASNTEDHTTPEPQVTAPPN